MSAHPYLTIVLTGRNDNFGGDFNRRLVDALDYNDRQLTAAAVPYEVVFVEWRPIAGTPLLADHLRRRLPHLDDRLVTIAVDTRYHDAFTQNPRLQFHEFIAKNVGIRRAVGSYILSTNTDIYLSDEIVSLCAQRVLRPMTLYRATRVDLKPGIDTGHLDASALADPANHLIVNTLSPPDFTNGAGDFLLLDRFSWHQLRGFNEVYRVAKIFIDANFCLRAAAAGLRPVDTEAHVYHVGAGTFNAQRGSYRSRPAAAPWGGPWHKRVLYENPTNWGLGDAPAEPRGPRDIRLAFSDAAVPPLVSLGRITGIAHSVHQP
jgi:hypothetical protein